MYSDEVLRGWGNRGYNWQAALTFQHELTTGIGVNVGYYRTWYGNFLVTDNTLVSPSDFDSYCIAAPTDSRLPNAASGSAALLEITPAKFGQVSNVVNLDSHYGGQSEVYDGVDVTLNARLGNGGLIGGGFATGRTVTDVCDVVDDVPEFAINLAATVALTTNSVVGPSNAPSRFCRMSPPWSALTQVKLFGTYPLPWDLRASFNYQHLPGVATTATYVISGAEIAAALGTPAGSRRPRHGNRRAARAAAAASREPLEPVELRAVAPVQSRRRQRAAGDRVAQRPEREHRPYARHALRARLGGGAWCAHPATDQACGAGGFLKF